MMISMAVPLFSQSNYALANVVAQQPIITQPPPSVQRPPLTFEKLIFDAIEELKSVKSSVDDHRIEKKICAIEKDIEKALECSEKGDYFKAFLRIRHATHLIEKLMKHHWLEASLSNKLKHVAYKLAVAVRYKVEESLEYAEDSEGYLKTRKLRKLKVSSEVLLDVAWRFYDRGVSELVAERYSKAISRFIVAYVLVRIVLRCQK